MLYLTTIKKVAELPEMEKGDTLEIFCKDTDTLRIQDAQKLLDCAAKAEFVPVSGRDDMLVCIGGIFATAEECTMLDATIPVPARYASRVHIPKKTAKTSAARKKAPAVKQAGTETEKKTQETPEAQEARVAPEERTEALPQREEIPRPTRKARKAPEAQEAPEQPIPMKSGDMPAPIEEEIQNSSAAAMQALLGITSEDIGFSWPTEMLMLQIIRKIAEAKSREDIKGEILSIRNGEIVWEALENKLDEAIAIVSRH